MADKKPAMKFSLSLGAKKQAPSPATVKRPAPALAAFEEEVVVGPVAQEVTAFDAAAGGAIDASAPQTTSAGPVVIAPQANRDWRAESRKKQKGRLPDGAQQGHSVAPSKETAGAPQIAFGLTVVKAQDGEATLDQAADTTESEQVTDMSPPEKPTEDQLAMQALLGQRPESTLVLDMKSEETVFQDDFSRAPPAPSLEDYAKVAIEDFGAAYLRGFGWKGDNSIQKNGKPEKRAVRRSALLGIGAKEEAAVGIELGEWGKSAKGSKRKVDQTYNPVLLLNKETGEKLTEEELKARIEQQKLVDSEPAPKRRKESPTRDLEYRTSEKSSRRHKYDDEDDRSASHRRRDDRDRDRDRERRKDRDYDSKHRSSRRDRSSSTDSRRKRKRRDHDERDSDSSKRRHKEDRYREDRHREDRYDRGSSKREDRDRGRLDDSGRRRKQEAY